MTEESAMSSVESSSVADTGGAPDAAAPAGPARPWLSSKGILLLLCVFLICMCAIIGLVVYLIILKDKSLPGGAAEEPEGPDR
ncbi:hypothetical protein MTO96_042310 [Rhipicephalus appendiculatus]|uniref:Uncharacterized protein n=1 Tax=Rhipicephalus appendiculatus TaxID=34631 RepID=A0A131YFN4_RHIAP